MSELTVAEKKNSGKYFPLAGRGLTSLVVAKEVLPTSEPLGSHNKLVIAPGILSGTGAANSGRLCIGFKSPLTGCIKRSMVGGTAASGLGLLGLKAIVVEGVSEEDEFFTLHVRKDGAVLVPAPELKGMKNYDVVKALHERHGENVSILSIGPAGEMKLPTATVASTDTSGYPCRHAGRGGVGAVMGAKGLKAIIIDHTGGPGVSIVHPGKFEEGAALLREAILSHPVTGRALRLLGSNMFAGAINAAGAYPTRNFRYGAFRSIDKVSGEYMYDLIRARGGAPSRPGCTSCVTECSNTFVDDHGAYVTSALEYGTIWAHGANLDVADLDVIARADRLCDEYGVDTIEIGEAVGVAMEAGVKEFGDAAGALELIEEVGKGTPLGRILGSGSWAAGKVLGVKRIPAVKKHGLGGYDPRAIHGMGVTYATSPMGADHTAGWVVPSNLASMGGTLDPHKARRSGRKLAAEPDHDRSYGLHGGCAPLLIFLSATYPSGFEGLLKMIGAVSGQEVTRADFRGPGKEGASG